MNGVNVEPSVAVIVEERHAAAHGLGELAAVAAPAIEGEGEAAALGVVGEGGNTHGGGDRGLCSHLGQERPEEVGERPATGLGRGPGRCQASQRDLGLGPGGLIPAGRQSPPGPGVERSAQRKGGAGELGCVLRRVDLVEHRRVAIACRVSRRLAASELGESLDLAVLRSQVSELLEAAGLVRLHGDELFKGLALGSTIAAPRGQPGTKRQQLSRGQDGSGDLSCRAHDLVRLAGSLGPLEPGAPYRGVAGVCPLAPLEQIAGLGDLSGTGRQVGLREPNAVVVGGHPRRILQFPANPFDRMRLVVEGPEEAQGLDGIARVIELATQEASVLVVPAGDPVKVCEQRSRKVGRVAPHAECAVEAGLGEPVAASAHGGPAARERRDGSLGCLVRDTAPSRHGGFSMAPGHLAFAKRILDFTLAGPALRQPGQTHPG